MRHRYEPVLSVDDSWMVFDIFAGEPAEIDGRFLIGLSADECGELARRLNRGQADRAAFAAREQEGPPAPAKTMETSPWKS